VFIYLTLCHENTWRWRYNIFLTSQREVSDQLQAPAAFPPGIISSYLLVKILGGSHVGLDAVEKRNNLLLLPGLDSLTVQAVVRRYIECIILAPDSLHALWLK
jgi:hypothetical protein